MAETKPKNKADKGTTGDNRPGKNFRQPHKARTRGTGRNGGVWKQR